MQGMQGDLTWSIARAVQLRRRTPGLPSNPSVIAHICTILHISAHSQILMNSLESDPAENLRSPLLQRVVSGDPLSRFTGQKLLRSSAPLA